MDASAALLNLLVKGMHLFLIFFAVRVLLSLFFRNDLRDDSVNGDFLDSLNLRPLTIVELVDP